ncbi:hypothetical protein [Streptomyces sp. NPDC018000]|uniref:hypothetical protein n=1 Tax=Streptomyces sp. NPDC018000 TaxID=3365028 RepID=UPI0037B30443
MPDIAVDYELLNQVAQKARSLKGQVQHARESKQDYSVADVGSGVPTAIRAYYSVWKSSFKRSEEKLEKLANLYEGVARGWADWDFKLAGEASKQEASLAADLYKTQKEIWDKWQEQVRAGNVDPDDPHAPKPPQGNRPTTWTTSDGHGNLTTTTYKYGEDGKPTKITTEVRTSTGLTSKDVTNYHPDGTYDSSATDVYGNVTTTTGKAVTIEEDGNKITDDSFKSVTKAPGDGGESTTTGTSHSVYNITTGHRDTTTTYTRTGPDDGGKQETVKGTSTTAVDLNGHEVVTTIEVKANGSGTKTVVTDGRTEKWDSKNAAGDTGWKSSDD